MVVVGISLLNRAMADSSTGPITKEGENSDGTIH
jgi:hypothetical protein